MQIRIAIVFDCNHRMVRITRPWCDTFSSHTVEKQIRSSQYLGGHYCYLHGFLRDREKKNQLQKIPKYITFCLFYLGMVFSWVQNMEENSFFLAYKCRISKQTSSLISKCVPKDLIHLWWGYSCSSLLLHFFNKYDKFKSEDI